MHTLKGDEVLGNLLAVMADIRLFFGFTILFLSLLLVLVLLVLVLSVVVY